jgi:hypothetical protein
MMQVEWKDPQTLWLNLTNLALGVITLLALAIAGVAVAREWIARVRRAREIDGLDAEMSHMLHVPELGMTMADGGESRKDTKEQ